MVPASDYGTLLLSKNRARLCREWLLFRPSDSPASGKSRSDAECEAGPRLLFFGMNHAPFLAQWRVRGPFTLHPPGVVESSGGRGETAENAGRPMHKTGAKYANAASTTRTGNRAGSGATLAWVA